MGVRPPLHFSMGTFVHNKAPDDLLIAQSLDRAQLRHNMSERSSVSLLQHMYNVAN